MTGSILAQATRHVNMNYIKNDCQSLKIHKSGQVGRLDCYLLAKSLGAVTGNQNPTAACVCIQIPVSVAHGLAILTPTHGGRTVGIAMIVTTPTP